MEPLAHYSMRADGEVVDNRDGRTVIPAPYTPKVGDRVRAYLDVSGTAVTAALTSGDNTWFRMRTADGFVREIHSDEGWKVEKLQDPEPKWVNGDVILISDGAIRTPMIYNSVTKDEPFWACTSCPRGWHPLQHVSADWSNGDVEILYKADGEKEAA